MAFNFNEKDNRKTEFIGLRVPKDLHRRLTERASAKGTDLSSFIRDICDEENK